MHFIDREKFEEAPISILEELKNSELNKKWAAYNSARINNTKKPSRPESAWRRDMIRNPLKKLFLKNCGYCGIHTGIGHDAEVDHFFPTSKDETAKYVFEWTNYVWSCPSCNRQKSNSYPFLNPCSLEEMKYIYFNLTDGTYKYYRHAPDNIISKYNLTDNKSKFNSHKRPENRRLLYREVQSVLKEIDRYYRLYKLECKIHGAESVEAKKKEEMLKSEKQYVIERIDAGHFLFLIRFLIEKYTKNNKSFPYTFQELLDESKYLEK